MRFDGDFQTDGVAIVRGLVGLDVIERLRSDAAFEHFAGAPGARGLELPATSPIAQLVMPGGVLAVAAAELMNLPCVLARVLLFDKTAESNWAVPWHQDRVIAVRERVEVEGFGPWSCKSGVQHVEPPADFLCGIVVLRLHVDDCDETNGALEVVPGSFRLGRLTTDKIADAVAGAPVRLLTARAGDVVAMRGLTIHASKRSVTPSNRRVVHVEFASRQLTEPLRWASGIS